MKLETPGWFLSSRHPPPPTDFREWREEDPDAPLPRRRYKGPFPSRQDDSIDRKRILLAMAQYLRPEVEEIREQHRATTQPLSRAAQDALETALHQLYREAVTKEGVPDLFREPLIELDTEGYVTKIAWRAQ